MAEEQVRNRSYEPVRIGDDDVDNAIVLRNCNSKRKFLVSSVLVVLIVLVVILAATSTGHLRQGDVTSMQQDWSLLGFDFGGNHEKLSNTTTKTPTTSTMTKSAKSVKDETDEKEDEEKHEKEYERKKDKRNENGNDRKDDIKKTTANKENANAEEATMKKITAKNTTATTQTKTEKDVTEEQSKKEGEIDEKEHDEKEDEGKKDERKENNDNEKKDKETKANKRHTKAEVVMTKKTTTTKTKTTMKKTTTTTTLTTTRGRATVPPKTKAPAADANPFKDKIFYDRQTHKKDYDYAIKYCTGGTLENLKKMRDVPSAFWVSKKAHIQELEMLLEDAASKSPPELVVVIWYDLPNRDCASKASTGEICCSKNQDGTCNYDDQTDCSSGLKEYKTMFVDPLVSLMQEYTLEHGVPIVVVVEPDSLPNLATNADDPHCGTATATAYKTGIKYTVEQLTSKTLVDVYIDAANGAWLGWEKFQVKFMEIIKEMTLPLDKVRGFTTNVAKYQPLGVMCPWEYHESGVYTNGHCLDNKNPNDACCQDPCHLLRTISPANNELNYVQKVVRAAKGILGMDAHTIIDTSRNGWEGMERDDVCANWCNLRGAGVGHVPTTETADPMVDAYFWLKTPGESDGCTEVLPNGTKCARFDESCKSENSIGTRKGEPRVDEAGKWFEYQLKELAANAHLGKLQKITV